MSKPRPGNQPKRLVLTLAGLLLLTPPAWPIEARAAEEKIVLGTGAPVAQAAAPALQAQWEVLLLGASAASPLAARTTGPTADETLSVPVKMPPGTRLVLAGSADGTSALLEDGVLRVTTMSVDGPAFAWAYDFRAGVARAPAGPFDVTDAFPRGIVQVHVEIAAVDQDEEQEPATRLFLVALVPTAEVPSVTSVPSPTPVDATPAASTPSSDARDVSRQMPSLAPALALAILAILALVGALSGGLVVLRGALLRWLDRRARRGAASTCLPAPLQGPDASGRGPDWDR